MNRADTQNYLPDEPQRERRLLYFRRGMAFDSETTVQAWTLAAREAHFNVHTLAEITSITVRQIERCCREELGRSPQEWLDEQRLIAARTLLLEHDSVKRVAMELGYKQLSHFCRQFKACYGMTPSEFLISHRRVSANVAHR